MSRPTVNWLLHRVDQTRKCTMYTGLRSVNFIVDTVTCSITTRLLTSYKTTPFMMYLPLTLPPHPQSLYSLSTLGYCNGTAQLHLGSTTVTTWPPTPCDYWIIIPFDTPSPHSFSVLISYPPTPGYCTGTAQLLPIGQKRSRPCPLWHSLSTIYLYTPYLTPYPIIL